MTKAVIYKTKELFMTQTVKFGLQPNLNDKKFVLNSIALQMSCMFIGYPHFGLKASHNDSSSLSLKLIADIATN